MSGDREVRRLPRVVLDARPTMGGVERYTLELTRLLTAADPGERIVLFGRHAVGPYVPAPLAGGMLRRLRRLPGAVRRILADQLLLPLAAYRHRADLVHSTNYLVPLLTRRPVVVTCHDLTLLDHFSTRKRGPMRYYARWLLTTGLRRAAHVITPSRTVAAQVVQRFGLPPDRVTPIYPPLPRFCRERATNHPVADPPFFLSVGTLEPRKNLARLLEGWRRHAGRGRVPLFLVGPYGWRQRRILAEQEDAAGLRWLGVVDDPTLSALYRKATAVVQFSLAEGFDYPVAEALCCGTPVVASDIPVHREVLADCALFAPPDDPAALAARLAEVAAWGGVQRKEWAGRARRRAALIDRSSSAAVYLDLYRRITAGQ